MISRAGRNRSAATRWRGAAQGPARPPSPRSRSGAASRSAPVPRRSRRTRVPAPPTHPSRTAASQGGQQARRLHSSRTPSPAGRPRGRSVRRVPPVLGEILAKMFVAPIDQDVLSRSGTRCRSEPWSRTASSGYCTRSSAASASSDSSSLTCRRSTTTSARCREPRPESASVMDPLPCCRCRRKSIWSARIEEQKVLHSGWGKKASVRRSDRV